MSVPPGGRGAERSPAPTGPAAAAGPDPEGGGRAAGRPPTPGRHRRTRVAGTGRWVAAAGLGLVAVLGVGAGVQRLERAPAVTAPDVGALPATTTPPPTTAAAPTTAAPRPTVAPKASPPPAAPNVIALPAQKVTAPVVAMGVRADGELAIPESPRTVGWWVGSPPAGSRTGTVLAGHVDSKAEGVGAFAALRDVAVGNPVVLTDVFGARHAYTVTARRTYPKYALPRSVFAAGVPLVLITCGGPFDAERGRYRDNIVVYAALS